MVVKSSEKVPAVEDVDDDAEHDESETADDELLEQARERYKLCCEVETKQRDREREDLRFQVPELQWTDASRKEREGVPGQTAGRPTLTVSQLDQPIGLIINQMRSADLGVQFHPVSEEAEPETAEAIQGLYRDIERDSNAELARAWAYDRAVKAGRGAYRVLTVYDEDGGDPSDQKIVIRRILHQDGVYFDPASEEPDYSDGRFAFVLRWMPLSEFKTEFPKAKISTAESGFETEGYTKSAPDWVRDDDYLVGEYWYKIKKKKKVTVGKGDTARRIEREYTKVYCVKLTGWEILEPAYEWPDELIPLVPVVGRELQPFDEERRYVGMIGPAKDAQRFCNFAASTAVERMALEPKAPFIGPARAFEGFESEWQQANTRNFPYMRYNDGDRENPVARPERAQLDQTGMSMAMMALQEGKSLVQSATAVFDPSLGKVPQKDRSGKAIIALQEQADAGTSHFLQNLVDISMTYEAKVIRGLLPKIYDRPERVVRIVRGDTRKTEPLMINAPHTIDPNTKRPVPVRMRPGMQQPQGVMEYNLAAGRYGVSVTIGKNYQTRRQQASDMIGEFITNQPQFGLAFLDLYLGAQDWPSADEMAKRATKLREQTMPGLSETDKTGQPDAEELKGKLQAMEQQGQQMQQVMQAMQQKIETEQAKQQASILKAQLDAQVTMAKLEKESDTKLRIAAADNETKLAIANLTSQVEALLTTLKLEHEAKKIEAAQQHETRMATEDKLFATVQGREKAGTEAMNARDQMKHEAAMGVLGEPKPEAPEPTEVPVDDGGRA